MRRRFIQALLDRVLPEMRPDEVFFSAGPPRAVPVVRRLQPQPARSVRIRASRGHASKA